MYAEYYNDRTRDNQIKFLLYQVDSNMLSDENIMICERHFELDLTLDEIKRLAWEERNDCINEK